VDSARPIHYSKSDRRVPREPKLSPWSSLTHSSRSIGYHNHNPKPLVESASRLMYLRVYDNRDNSHQPSPSQSLGYSLTHTHINLPTPTFLTITYTQVLWFSPVSVFSLSLYRHPFLYTLFNSRFTLIINNTSL
jgi:hypothetical protein